MKRIHFLALSSSLILLAATSLHANQARQRAITEVARLGGTIDFEPSQSQKAPEDRTIIKIDLHSTKVTDADLVFLKDLTELRALDLRLTKISDAGVANLNRLTKLETLNLFRTQLSDAGMVHLRRLTKLETL